MLFYRTVVAGLCGLIAWSAAALGASSINTAQPPDGFPYAPSVIRGNFGAAANDINALQSLNAGPTAPSNPSVGTLWLNKPQNATILTLNIWDGAAWVPVASLDTVNHIWAPPIGGDALPTLLSATTTDLGSVPQASLNVSGSNNIQSFGNTALAGNIKVTLFTGAPTITGSSSMLIPGGATSITQQAGDVAISLALGGGTWQILFDSRLLQSCSAVGGFSCTTVTTKTAAYVVQPSDCSNVLQFSGNAYYTITVNAPGSYPANCQLTLTNLDVGRAKLAVISGAGQIVIWPGTTLIVQAGGGMWNFPRSNRWHIPGNTTFYVDPINGQDFPAEDCLAPTTGACQTIQQAVTTISRHIDFNNFTVTVQLAQDSNPGDYKPFQLNGPLVGVAMGGPVAPSGQSQGNLVVAGATNVAANYLLDGQGAASCVALSNGATIALQNLTLQNCNRLINEFGQATSVFVTNVSFGSCALGSSTPAQMFVGRLGYLEFLAPYQIIGSANCGDHYDILANGILWADAMNTGPTLATITANLSYSTAFARPYQQSAINFKGYSSSPYSLGSNTVSAIPYRIQGASTVELGNSGNPANFFPGNSPGETYDTSTLNANEHDQLPTIASCGGGSPSLVLRSSDNAGVVTEGTSTTSCVINFAGMFARSPICNVTPETGTVPTTLGYLATTTQLTITHDVASGAAIAYRCTGG